MRWFMWLVWGTITGVIGILHLLFAVANFRFGGLAIAEGACSALAGTTLLASAIVIRRSRLRAARLILIGTLPLTFWFAFTVPEHSDWVFLYLSLIVPGAALLFIVLTYFSRHTRHG